MILKVINKTTVLFLTFVLLANGLNNIVIVTGFIINQDFIAKTLCIQKEEQKGCNGKCQLKRELAQNNTDSDSPLSTNNKTRLDVFVINTITNHCVEGFSQHSIKQNNIDYRLKQPTSGFYTIDTPPPNLS